MNSKNNFRNLLAFSALALASAGIARAQNVSTPPLDASGEVVSLPDLTVEGRQDESYGAAVGASSTKLALSLFDTPQAISVVPRALLDDQGVHKLNDALKNVAGVSVGGYYSEWDYYRIRGFDASFNTYVDGLRGDYDGVGEETFGLERVEVVKGPASSLFGQGPLGGIVNIVTKKPKHELGGELGFTGGTWDSYEGTLDFNAPLKKPEANHDLGVYFRLLGLRDHHGSFVDYYDYTRIYVAPSLTFEWGDDTSLTLLMHYKNDAGPFSMPLPAAGTVLPNPNGEIPIRRFIGIPGETGTMDVDTFRLGYELKHRFSDAISLRQNAGYYRVRQTWDDILYNASLDADMRTLYANPYQYDKGVHQRLMVDTGLDAVGQTGPIKHLLTFGVDYFQSDQNSRYQEIDYDDFPGSYVAIDLFNPDYDSLTLPPYASATSFHTQEHSVGLYLQDHASLTERITLTAGGRYEFLWLDDGGSWGGAPFNARDHAFTPKAGLTYGFAPGFAGYANWSRSFKPQWYSSDASGAPVAPETGENWETGLKYSLLEGKFSGLLSVFRLTRQNVATSDLSTPEPYDAAVSGEQRSQGVEFEVAARPVAGLELTAAYTYLDAEVTDDNDIPVGTLLLNVPDHTINAWLKYTLQNGPLKGFGVGLGGHYYSSQSGDTYHTFDLPAYGLVDAALYYQGERFRTQVNFNNVCDKKYFVGSYDELYVLPGEPLNVRGSVSWKF